MENVYTTGGIGFHGMITIVFITLKLLGVITWSWWWVLAPIWVPMAITIVLLILIGIIALATK